MRPEHARHYPELVPGVWMSATRAARLIRQADPEQLRVHACGCMRVMCELHFEFRGGRRQPGPGGDWRARAEHRGPYQLSTIEH